jgi:hypothetical protein
MPAWTKKNNVMVLPVIFFKTILRHPAVHLHFHPTQTDGIYSHPSNAVIR